MSVTTIAIVVAIVAGLIAVLAARGSGPRVTHIDRTVRKKDSDDA